MKKFFLLLLSISFLNVAFPNSTEGVMSEEEKTWLLEYLDETGRYLIDMLADVEADHWHQRQTEGVWTISECAEHILLTEKGILQKIKKLLVEQKPDPAKQPGGTSTELILTAVMDRVSKREKTIRPLEPSNRWKTKEAFLETFQESRSMLKDFIKNNNSPLHHLFTNTPIGEVDLYQNLVVLAAHTSRHTMQIEEVKSSLGLRTATLSWGGACKVNTLSSDREKVKKLFGDLLHLKIESTEKHDKVFFEEGGFVVFLYTDDASKVLTQEQHLNSMWGAIKIPAHQYQSVRQRLKAFGVSEVFPEKDQSKYFYFHLPGGQVFRLVKNEKKATELTYDEKKAKAFGADEYGMKKYVMAFLKKGPNRNLSQEEANKLQMAHLENIDKMADEGKLVLAGPFFGNGELRGIYIFNVSTIAEAEALTKTDPAIKAGSLKMELMEWYGSAGLVGLNDLHKTLMRKNVSENPN